MDYQQKGSHLFDYLGVLRKRRWVVVTAFIGTLLSTLVHTLTAIPIYETSITIQIEEKAAPRFSLSKLPIDLDFKQFDPLKTEAEIIKSRTIIGRLVEKLPLDEEGTPGTLQERIKRLQGAIGVEPVRGTNILRISLQDKDPERAADVLNRLSSEYIQQSLSVARAEASQAKEFVERQLQTVKADLDNSQSAMERFKSKEGVTILSEDMKNKIDKLSGVETKRVQIEMEINALEEVLLSLKKDKELVLTGISISNPAIEEYARRLAELQVQKGSMRNYYADEHPSMIKINAAIWEAKSRLKGEAEKVLRDLRGREKTLKDIIGGYEEEIKSLPRAEQELTNIMRTLTVSEGIYTFLLEKEKEAEIAMASEVGNIRVIDSAVPPEKPIKPDTKLNIILGAIVGLCLGVGISFFMEYINDTVKGRDETEKYLGLPLFGALPFIDYKNGLPVKRKEQKEGQRGLLLKFQEQSKSYLGEAYRTLRTNIQFSETEKRSQLILITSPVMSEGKSITAANLATVFTMDGAKTLLIDADLRRPIQHKIFNCPQEPGLTNILMGRSNWSDTILKPGVDVPSLIPSGPIPPNPSELLGTKRMDELLISLKGLFDTIIIDTTPVVGLTDALVLAPKVDGVFILMEVEKTPIKLAMQAKDSLRMVKANIIGAILNKVPIERNGYGYGYGYSYHYYHYYREDGEKINGESFLKRWRNKRKIKDKTKA